MLSIRPDDVLISLRSRVHLCTSDHLQFLSYSFITPILVAGVFIPWNISLPKLHFHTKYVLSFPYWGQGYSWEYSSVLLWLPFPLQRFSFWEIFPHKKIRFWGTGGGVQRGLPFWRKFFKIKLLFSEFEVTKTAIFNRWKVGSVLNNKPNSYNNNGSFLSLKKHTSLYSF